MAESTIWQNFQPRRPGSSGRILRPLHVVGLPLTAGYLLWLEQSLSLR